MTYSKYAFKTDKEIQYCYGSDIMYCTCRNKQTHIIMHNSNQIFISKPIKEIEKIITSNYFIKANSSHIVNINQIKEYSPKNPKLLTMNDGKIVKISSSKISKLHVMLKSIIENE